MKIVIKAVEGYLRQPFPSLVVDTNHKKGYKYVVNVPAQTQRYLSQHDFITTNKMVYLFTKTHTSTVSGLPCALYHNIMLFQDSYSKIYGNSRLLEYIEELKYKMGYGIAHFSYCSWIGDHRKGITSRSIIRDLAKRVDFSQRYEELQQYISCNIDKNKQNNALESYDPKKGVYQDQFMKIRVIKDHEKQGQITQFLFQPKQLPQVQIKTKQKSFLGSSFLILHHINAKSVEQTQKNQKIMKILQKNQGLVIFHIFDSQETAISKQFITFINSLPKNIENVVCSRVYKSQDDKFDQFYQGYHHIRFTTLLHHIYQKYFPNLGEQYQVMALDMFKRANILEEIFKNTNIMSFHNFSSYSIESKTQKGKLISTKMMKQRLQLNQKHELINPENKFALKGSLLSYINQCNAKVTFLGTASSYSTPLRNTSCILIELPDMMTMWDCGTGSYTQFYNHFGMDTEKYLLKTQLLFITHCHSDHILGMMQFISQRNRLKDHPQFSKLFLVIPINMLPWYVKYCQIVEDVSLGCQIVFVQSIFDEKYESILEDLKKGGNKKMHSTCKKNDLTVINELRVGFDLEIDLEFNKKQWSEIISREKEKQTKAKQIFIDFLHQHSITEFVPVPVYHCPQAFAICMQHKSGVKISYSGDTRPWPAFIEAAKDSTLLIHQATFNDSNIGIAKEYNHSTVEEAITVGMKSRSWKTALTHFSQRSFSVGQMINLSGHLNWKTIHYAQHHAFLACDHLNFHLSQMANLPAISRKVSKEIVYLTRTKFL